MHDVLVEKIHQKIHLFLPESIKRNHRLAAAVFTPLFDCDNFFAQICQWLDIEIDINQHNTLKAHNLIGREFTSACIYIDNNFDANLLAALSGTVTGGGLLIMILPPKNGTASPFLKYVSDKITNDHHILNIEHKDEELHVAAFNVAPASASTKQKDSQPTVIEAIEHAATLSEKHSILISADRGRGKSAAVGIAVGNITKQKPVTVIITATSRNATNIIYKHIKLSLGNDVKENIPSQFRNNIFFIPPDALLRDLPAADLVVVDEAASQNPRFLERIIEKYQLTVFATTLHGYEGAGNSFSMKFKERFFKDSNRSKVFELQTPIRWNDNDPLESFINKTFMLSTEEPPVETKPSSSSWSTEIISHQALTNNMPLLQSAISLLKSAHYKTSPNDLKQMMNSSESLIIISRYETNLMGICIAEQEGNIEDDLANEIYHGIRRPKGHLLPQSLIYHLGIKEAAALKYLRVMRIAVHPGFQNKGIGSEILDQLSQYATKNQYDVLGASFGGTRRLLNFWQDASYDLIRIGYKTNKFSGERAFLMLKAISSDVKKLCECAREKFITNFHYQKNRTFTDLPSEISNDILKIKLRSNHELLTDEILNDVKSFAFAFRNYDDCYSSIQIFIKYVIDSTDFVSQLSKNKRTLIQLRLRENKTWPEISKLLPITGKKEGVAQLKESLKTLLSFLEQS